MITIGEVETFERNNLAIISSEIITETSNEIIFFAVKKEQEAYLCKNRADALLIAVLAKAMKHHQDIFVESLLSERLLYGLNTFLIPALVRMNAGFSKINIIANKLTSENINKYNGIATGISCGVDSLYTVLSNLSDEVPDSLNLTHLTLFSKCLLDSIDSIGIENKNHKLYAAGKICQELNLIFVPVWSNVATFSEHPYESVHTFCNIAYALAVQKLIKTYFYASGHSINEFRLNFSDTSHYDLLNEVAIKTESFEMISYNMLVNRFEKTRIISQYELVWKNLDVCTSSERPQSFINCSMCFKCIRTMLTLDVLGIINYFDSAFDLELYKKNYGKYWGKIFYIYWKNKDEFAKEIITNAKAYKYKIPVSSYFWMSMTGINNLTLKLKRILFRNDFKKQN